MGLRAIKARDRPSRAESLFDARVDARFDAALPGAKVAAEPGDDDGDALEARAHRLQIVEGGFDIGDRDGDMPVLRRRLPWSKRLRYRRRLVAEFGRAGDERHRARHAFERADRPHDLERELRDAVGKGLERQPFEHGISEAAMGGRIARALLGDDQGIGRLILGAAIEAHVQTGEIERLAIGPDTPDPPDRTFAQADGDIGEIAVLRRDRLRDAATTAATAATAAEAFAAATAAATAAGGLGRRGDDLFEFGRPDDLARETRASINARDRRALGRGHHVEIGEARAFDAARAAAAAAAIEQRVVEQIAGERADQTAGDGADRAEQCAADGAAGDGQNKRSHVVKLCWSSRRGQAAPRPRWAHA